MVSGYIIVDPDSSSPFGRRAPRALGPGRVRIWEVLETRSGCQVLQT